MPSSNVLRWNASSHLAKIFLDLVPILFPTYKYLERVSAFQSVADDEFVAVRHAYQEPEEFVEDRRRGASDAQHRPVDVAQVLGGCRSQELREVNVLRAWVAHGRGCTGDQAALPGNLELLAPAGCSCGHCNR